MFHFSDRGRHRIWRDWLTLTRGIAFGSLTHRRLDCVAEKRIGRHRSLCARHDRAQRRTADRHRRRRGLLCPRRRLGQQLDGRCSLTVSGMTPPARYWTVTLYNTEGRSGCERDRSARLHQRRDRARRRRPVSRSLSRRGHGPGNWLPTGGIEQYVLVWRLYDTPIGVATRTAKEGPMPAIARKGCS